MPPYPTYEVEALVMETPNPWKGTEQSHFDY